MTQRAASCTIDVYHPDGNCVFIFINRPSTDYIDYIRFDAANPTNKDKAQAGRIGSKDGQIKATSGPLCCVAMPLQPGQANTTSDIRLYFVANGTLSEARCPAAGPKSDMKNGWVLLTPGTDDTASIMNEATGVSHNSRAVDQTSYMSSGKLGGQHPYVIWQSMGQPNSTEYAWSTKDGNQMSWTLKTLPVKLQ